MVMVEMINIVMMVVMIMDDGDDDDELCSHLLTVETMSQRSKRYRVEMPDTQMPDSTRRCPTCRCSRSGSGPSSCAAALSLRVSGRLEPQVRSGLSVHTLARCGLSIVCLTSILL